MSCDKSAFLSEIYGFDSSSTSHKHHHRKNESVLRLDSGRVGLAPRLTAAVAMVALDAVRVRTRPLLGPRLRSRLAVPVAAIATLLRSAGVEAARTEA